MDNAILSMQPEAAAMPPAGPTVKSETLRSIIIPYRGGQAILPNNLVVEVLPYAPSLGIENAPPWVIGSMLWKALPLPLVSLEFLAADGQLPEAGTHNRIIVIQALNNHPKLRYFGIVGSEAPRMVELERDQISKEMFLSSMPQGIAVQVKVDNQPGFIPDLDAIELTLSNVLNAARAL